MSGAESRRLQRGRDGRVSAKLSLASFRTTAIGIRSNQYTKDKATTIWTVPITPATLIHRRHIAASMRPSPWLSQETGSFCGKAFCRPLVRLILLRSTAWERFLLFGST